jgi:DNA-binding transcriptional LysR family regulator
MPLTLDTLVILDAIDRRGSFARAAEELDRAPSSLTYAVQQLEADLDVLVFDRSGHRARLTPAGQTLLDEGRILLKAAAQTEQRVRQVADGWEPTLTLAIDAIVPTGPILDCVAGFDALGSKTALRLRREVLAGMWDVLLSGEADLVIGVTGEGPPGGGYRTRVLGKMEFIFCVSLNHPLAKVKKPLTESDIQVHRVIAISDTARNLPLRSTGVLQRQVQLAVPDLATKLLAQQKGLGVGNVPRWLFESPSAHGLVAKKLAAGNPHDLLYLAWRSGDSGRALAWFIQRLSQPGVFDGVLEAL